MTVRPVVSLFLSSFLLPFFMHDSDAAVIYKDPLVWLEDMGDAFRETNYDATYTYFKGNIFDSVRVVHIFEKGKEEERRFNLNGENREFYREGKEVECVHSKENRDGALALEHGVNLGPFSSSFPERIIGARGLYNFALLSKTRVMGRSAVQLAVSPRFNDRYGYRIWIDEESGLLLKSVLVDRGRVKEIFQIVQLRLGDAVDERELISQISKSGFSHTLLSQRPAKKEKPVIRVNWLPSGFKSVRRRANRLHFTDGLANFSVFVDRSGSDSLPDLATSVGGTVLLTKKLKVRGHQITIVGNVPMQTAKKVAESVEPLVY
jgi:sigma-E factor negative regulatory protein RseB